MAVAAGLLLCCLTALLGGCDSRPSADTAPTPQEAADVSYTPGSTDEAGWFMGGTEMRALAARGGKLYAGNGYWEDQPGPEGRQGAQILVLDAPGAHWRVDHDFEERMPGGRPRHLAVSALQEITFATDGAGARLASPVSMLIASTWDLTAQSTVFTRDDKTGFWTAVALSFDPEARRADFLPQVRSFALHRDRVTGVDLVFAGQVPRGIFRGAYDPTAPGHIRWSDTPEIDPSKISLEAFPGLAGRLRISSFAECNGRLYAAIGQQVYERIDGAQPRWSLVYTNPNPGRSKTGLRGLTSARDEVAGRDVLLAAVEGNAARIVRIDPRDGSETTEIDLDDFLAKAWDERAGYAIAAYNDMAKVRDPSGHEVLLIGFEAFIPPDERLAAGHDVVDVGYGRLESNAWYLIRRSGADYELRRVPRRPGAPMVAPRAILASPFADDGGAVYFAGYDTNRSPVHNTAWIVRSPLAEAVGKAR